MRYQVIHLYAAEPVGENVGQFRHHLENPVHIFANDEEFEVTMLSVYDQNFCEIGLQVNLVILHGFARPEYATLLQARRAQGLPTVFEIADDWFSIGAWLPEKQRQVAAQQRADLLNLAAQADALLFCSKGLESVFAQVNKQTAVLDYFVPSPKTLLAKSNRFVFGWAGSTTHFDDMAAVVPAIEAFCKRHPDTVFSMMGNPSTFAPLFQNIPTNQIQIQGFGAYDRYLEFLKSLQVGIAPLVLNAFNRGRTDAKFVEYAVNGVAAVLSDVEVFRPHATRAMLFTDNSSLLECLEQLYNSPDLRQNLALMAFDWVRQERGTKAIKQQHKDFYKQLIGQTPPTQVHLERGETTIRHSLSAAWAEYTKQNFQATLDILDHLQATTPDLDMALWMKLLTLKALKQNQEILELASSKRVSAIYLPLIAQIGYQAASKIDPSYITHFYQFLPQLAKIQLSEQAPVQRFRAILDIAPYDYFALMGMIYWLEENDPTATELRELQQRTKFFTSAHSLEEYL
jgi:hypothetical protein